MRIKGSITDLSKGLLQFGSSRSSCRVYLLLMLRHKDQFHRRVEFPQNFHKFMSRVNIMLSAFHRQSNGSFQYSAHAVDSSFAMGCNESSATLFFLRNSWSCNVMCGSYLFLSWETGPSFQNLTVSPCLQYFLINTLKNTATVTVILE